MRLTRFFILLLTLCAYVPDGASSFAQKSEGSVLFVAPHRMTVPPDGKMAILNVANKSDKQRRYDLTIVDQVMGEDGITKRVDSFPYSIKRMVKFQPRRFTLNPGERQTVRVQIDRPPDLADGDYHSHLLFREVPTTVKDKKQLEAERKAAQKENKATFEIRTLYGIGVPVIIQHGKIESDIGMGDARLSMAPDGATRILSADFTRSGNAEAAGKLTAQYVQPGMAPIDVITPQWIRLYHEVDKVTRNFQLSGIPVSAAGGKIVLSLARDENDNTKTINREVAFN